MFGIGMPELLLILAIALIVIGPKKLPDLAKSLGRALGEFKKATSDLKETLEIDTDLSDVKKAFDDMNQEVRESMSGEAEGTEDSARPASGGQDPLPGTPSPAGGATDDTGTKPPLQEEVPPESDGSAAPDEVPDTAAADGGTRATHEPSEMPAAADDAGVRQEESGRHG